MAMNTPLGPGTRYPWENGAPATSGMPAATPAVAPGGAAPAVAPGGGNSIFSTTPTRPSNVYLSPQEQQAILKAAGYPGGTIAGGQAIPQPKLGTNVAGGSTLIDTGEYQVAIQDAQGRNIGAVTVTKGNPDEQGNPTWGLSDVPKSANAGQSSPTDYVVKTSDNGTWYPNDINNPGGGYHQILPPGVKNEDEEIKKAVDRQVAEGERNARQRNEATTGIYGTDAEVAKIQNDAATQKLNAAELQEKIRQYNISHKYDDQQQKILDDKAASDLLTASTGRAATQATTAGTQATTAATQQTTQQAAEKFPGELKQQAATLAATQASTASTQQATQIAGAPQPVQATFGTGNAQYATIDPKTGQVTFAQNPNFTPKTQADVAARVGQLQNLMTQKGQEVQAKVGQTIGGKVYTAEDALRDFNTWHDQNIAPQQQSLQAAQEEALFARAKDEAGMRQQAYQAALGAGNQNVSAFNAMVGANPVGAGYGEVMDLARQGKMPTGEQMKNAFTYQAANPMESARNATMEALKYIDPRVAAANGMPPPNPQGIDINAMIGRASAANPYAAPGVAAPAPAPAPPPAPVAPPPPAPSAGPALGMGSNILRGLAQGTGPNTPGYAVGMPGTMGLPGQGALIPGLAQGGNNPWQFAPDYSFG